ncbi:MAG: tyrosine-type recombinase/integrase [Chlorobiaceae bacterium]|nr:tyrosine-type recombinase/integrase [Chlorobiaceae bacterium]
MTLTDAHIRNASCPEEKRSIELFDTKGLLLRIQKNGTKLWRYRYRTGHINHSIPLGSYPEISLLQARQLRDRAINLRRAKLDPADHLDKLAPVPEASAFVETPVSEAVTTFSKVVEEYIASLDGKPSQQEVKRCLEREAVSKIGDREASTITKRELVLLIDIVKDRAPVQANRLYSYLKRAFTVAMQRGLLESNPMEYVVKPEPHADIRNNALKVLTKREILQIINHDRADEEYRYHDALLMILWTGARPNEVLNMKWSQIRNNEWTLGPKEHKNGFRRPISITRPLIGPALQILASFQNNGYDHVFAGQEGKPGSVSALGKFVTRYRNRYGIDGFSPNHLRHTISTRMRGIGIRPDIVERIIGHNVDSGIAGVYSSYSWVPEMRQALERWQQWILVEGTVR